MDVESIRLDPELAHQMMALLGRELKSTKNVIEQLRAELATAKDAAVVAQPQHADHAAVSVDLQNEIDELKEKLRVAGGRANQKVEEFQAQVHRQKTEIILLQAERQRLVERAETSDAYAKRVAQTAEALGVQSQRLRASLGAAHVYCGPECGSTMTAPLVVDPIEDLMERQELISGLKDHKKALLKAEQERDNECEEKERLKEMCGNLTDQVEDLIKELIRREQSLVKLETKDETKIEPLDTGVLEEQKVEDVHAQIMAPSISPAKPKGTTILPTLEQNSPGPIQVPSPGPSQLPSNLVQMPNTKPTPHGKKTANTIAEAPAKVDTTPRIGKNYDFKRFLASLSSKLPKNLPAWNSLSPICKPSSKELEKLFHSVSGSHSPTYLYFPKRSVWRDSQSLVFAPSQKLCNGDWIRNTTLQMLVDKHVEYFFKDKEEIYYAGTYRCHETSRWFPSGLQVGTDVSIAEMTLDTVSQKQAKDKVLMSSLKAQYSAGKLKVECLVLECIGFNYSLYEQLCAGSSKKRKSEEDIEMPRRSKRSKTAP